MSAKKIEKINGESVFNSELVGCLEQAGFIREYKCLAIV
jgi:hypothetical protein